MTDVIGYAGQIIEVIQAVRGVYVRIKGLGREIDDAMSDCGNMETDILTLRKLFNKNTTSKFPEQTTIITAEFKSLHKSIKKLKKLFREYEKISQKLWGKFLWAYDKPRENIFEIRSRFAEYRNIFMKALQIINEGHNRDQAAQMKELKEQARKFAEERKRGEKEMKLKLREMDERNRKANDRLEKLMKELVEKKTATPENRKKVVEGWLVSEKGVGVEAARTCADDVVKKGTVLDRKSNVKKDDQSKKGGDIKMKPKREGDTKAKVVEGKAAKSTKSDVKDGTGKGTKPSDPKPPKADIKGEKPKPLKEPTPLKPALVDKKPDGHSEMKKPSNHTSNQPPNHQKAPPGKTGKDESQNASKVEKKKDPPQGAKKPKVPVIIVQDIDKKSPPPAHKDKAPGVTLVPNKSTGDKNEKPKQRASSVSSAGSDKSGKARIEKGVRYVEVEGASQHHHSSSPSPGHLNDKSKGGESKGNDKPKINDVLVHDKKDMMEKWVKHIKLEEKRGRSQEPPKIDGNRAKMEVGKEKRSKSK
jgi:hypothetical protein